MSPPPPIPVPSQWDLSFNTWIQGNTKIQSSAVRWKVVCGGRNVSAEDGALSGRTAEKKYKDKGVSRRVKQWGGVLVWPEGMWERRVLTLEAEGRWLECSLPLLPCYRIMNFSNPIWQKLESYKVFDLYLVPFKMRLNHQVTLVLELKWWALFYFKLAS